MTVLFTLLVTLSLDNANCLNLGSKNIVKANVLLFSKCPIVTEILFRMDAITDFEAALFCFHCKLK